MFLLRTLPVVILAVVLTNIVAATAAPPDQPWFPKAPPLPKPTGQVTEVATVEELFRAAENAQPGETILVAEGHYMLPSVLTLATDNVMLRGRSGDRHAVVLDGADSRHGGLVLVRGQGVTVADLTIPSIQWNGFKIAAELGAQGARVYNCVIHNIWQRGVKTASTLITTTTATRTRCSPSARAAPVSSSAGRPGRSWGSRPATWRSCPPAPARERLQSSTARSLTVAARKDNTLRRLGECTA